VGQTDKQKGNLQRLTRSRKYCRGRWRLADNPERGGESIQNSKITRKDIHW